MHLRNIAIVFSALSIAGTAWAHHSAAPFDFTKLQPVDGIVKRFEVVNPHTHALVTITGGPRGSRDVVYEGHSASNFYRAGYKRGSIKAGDQIRLLIAPRRNGADGGFIMQFRDAQGKVVGFGNLAPGSGQPKS